MVAAWLSRVPSWVIPLLTDYVVPDDAVVITGVEFATLDDGTGCQTVNKNKLTVVYPGIVPDYSLDPEVTPTTGGTQFNLKAKKAVGFYGVGVDVSSYDDGKLNKWTFPLVRRNFGFLTMSRFSSVAYDAPLHYENQYHIAESVQALALNYDDDFSTSNLFNSVDKFCLTRADFFLYPEVELNVCFLPIWEVWAIRFFQSADVCSGSTSLAPPVPINPSSPQPPYSQFAELEGTDGSVWRLKCSESNGFEWEFQGYIGG